MISHFNNKHITIQAMLPHRNVYSTTLFQYYNNDTNNKNNYEIPADISIYNCLISTFKWRLEIASSYLTVAIVSGQWREGLTISCSCA